MVINAQTGDLGFFRVDSKTKEAVTVRAETVTEQATALPPAPQPPQPPRMVYPQAPAASPQISTRTILLAVLFILLAVTGGILALVYYRPVSVYGGALAITHNPPAGPFTIANPITFDANVTGSNLINVTFAYRIVQLAAAGQGVLVGNLVTAPMLLKAAGQNTYSYTIPSSEMSGVYVQYYISAFDTSNNVVRTDVYNLSVGDFNWSSDKTDEVIVTRTITSRISLALTPINGFSKAVTIRIAGSAPAGVSIRPVSGQVVPPNPVTLEITSTTDSQLVREYAVEIDAVYSPPSLSSVQIVRKTTLVLTVTDFDFDITPTYQKVTVPSYYTTPNNATYSLVMNVYHGFNVPNGFKISVSGLPAYTSSELVLVDYKINQDDTATVTYNLVVIVQPRVTTGLYLFTVTISAATTGGTISHNQTSIQVEITT